MKLIITQWALDSYLNLKHINCFTKEQFEQIIYPDVLMLKSFPHNPKFTSQQFWCPVKISQNKINGGFKMKWDGLGLGNSNNELRLLVTIHDDTAYLCEAYHKQNNNELRRYYKFKTHNEFIKDGIFIQKGVL